MALLTAGVFALMATTPSLAAAPTAPGQIFAFGYNLHGELGITASSGMSTANSTPALVSLPGSTGPAIQIAAGTQHTLVVTSTGQLYAFGDNSYGQLGIATNSGMSTANPTPALVSLPGASGPVTQVAAGAFHSLAVTSTGQLYGFGYNQSGQLGTTTNNGQVTANPTPALVSLPGATGPVTQVAAGNDHSLALTSTGQVYAFGDNDYGALGNTTNDGGAPSANPTPALVSLPGASGPVVQMAAGDTHSLALTSTGQLYSWGDNLYGQLGTMTHSGTMFANPTAALVALPGAGGPVTQIAAGGNHSLALTSTGQLYAFGLNNLGQLGSTTNPGGANPTPALVGALPGASGPIAQIAAGYSDSLAVTSTGQLYAFGDNYYGQLGATTNTGMSTANPTPALVAFPAGTTIDHLARGSEALHTLVIVADLAVTSSSLAAGQVGVAYAATVQATGGSGTYHWSATGLPAGLTINATSGQITGTPTGSGAPSVVLTVTDADGITATSAGLALTIAPAAVKITPLTTAALRSQLAPHGKTAKIAALLKHGYRVAFRAPGAGTVVIDWYELPKGAHLAKHKPKPKPVLVAIGTAKFAAAGTESITLKLTTKGRHLLKAAKHIRLTAKGTFTATGTPPVTATKSFTLTR